MSNQYRCKPYFVKQLNTSHRWLKRGGLRQKRRPKIDAVHAVDFMCRDDNSRLTAGKDRRTKKKEKQQIRHLHFSVDVLFEKYTAEHPYLDISRTTFYRLKPFLFCSPTCSALSSVSASTAQICKYESIRQFHDIGCPKHYATRQFLSFIAIVNRRNIGNISNAFFTLTPTVDVKTCGRANVERSLSAKKLS